MKTTANDDYRVTFTARMANAPLGSQHVNRRFTTFVEARTERQAVLTARARVTELYGDRAYRLTSASIA